LANRQTVRTIHVETVADELTWIVNHRRFDSFGNLTSETNTAIDLDYAYTGKYFDDFTGLFHHWNRWYDPKLGKWISEDPIGFAGGDTNLGRYVGNGVYNFVDSNGLIQDPVQENDDRPISGGTLILPPSTRPVSVPPWVITMNQVGDAPRVDKYRHPTQILLEDRYGFSPRGTLPPINAVEAHLLDQLHIGQYTALTTLSEHVQSVIDQKFPETRLQQDGHADAFKHAYGAALLSLKFGEDWARRYTTAHEMLPGNEAAREAMDLYNNSIGLDIARTNPSLDELPTAVDSALTKGELLVIDLSGGLTYSDQVPFGQSGSARPGTLPGFFWPPINASPPPWPHKNPSPKNKVPVAIQPH
jgi:RHS repeat-associated protein